MKLAASVTSATARAPATVANVAVGFDVLGFALARPHDTVTVARDDAARAESGGVRVEVVAGASPLPLEPERNTAGAALLAMRRELGWSDALVVRVDKGIAIGSGMGGSAASAVGAVVAANALLAEPLAVERLLPWALAGEAAASGAPHADNVAPCLWGGLVAALPGDPPAVVSIPLPDRLYGVVVRPALELATRDARAMLAPTVRMAQHVEQSAYLAGFVAACHRGDLAGMRATMRDVVVGPQRAAKIPGYDDVRRAALAAGAIGCGIAGAGPSMFAWAESRDVGERVRDAMQAELAGRELESQAWVEAIAGAPGAAVVETR